MKIGTYEISVPFVTTASETTKGIVQFADLKPGQIATDLGSGDGRVVLELAKAGLIVTEFEIKPELVKRANDRIHEAGLEKLAITYVKDFWKENLSAYDVIYLYGMQSIMGRLEEKLDNEIRPGAKVILNIFHLPHWKVKKTNGKLHVYIKTESV